MVTNKPCKALRPTQKRRAGFTLVELLIGVMVIAFGFSAAATLFRNAEYSAIKARIEGRVAALIRHHTERMLYMPYSTLASMASGGSSVESGHLYQPAASAGYGDLYPYTVVTALTLMEAGTSNEQVSISTTIRWQEPSPEFSRAENLQKEIHLGTHSRRRF